MWASRSVDRRRRAADVDRVGLKLLAAGEGEQPADQLGALLGGAAGHAEDLLLLLLERQPALDQAEAAEHRGEQIVEIVRDAAGQLADRVHLAAPGAAASRASLRSVTSSQGAGIFGRRRRRIRAAARPGRGNACTGRRRSASDIRSPIAPVALAVAERGQRRARGRRDGAGRPRASGRPRPSSNAKPVIAAKLPPTNCGHARRRRRAARDRGRSAATG